MKPMRASPIATNRDAQPAARTVSRGLPVMQCPTRLMRPSFWVSMCRRSIGAACSQSTMRTSVAASPRSVEQHSFFFANDLPDDPRRS